MNYKRNNENNQLENNNFLKIPSNLERFTNTNTTFINGSDGNKMYSFDGYVALLTNDLMCPNCDSVMHKHNSYNLKKIDMVESLKSNE